jgi:c-di-GMP-binding flagellar brake protein YcgR
VESHPNLNEPVVLRDGTNREFHSRVEDLGSGLLVVMRPQELRTDEEYDVGTEISVVWADSEGEITVTPTRILAVHAKETMRLWSLVVTGPATRQQRRSFVRAAATGDVAIRPAAGDGTGTVTGTLIDVSERAVHCTVGAGMADRFVADNDQVIAEFGFGTAGFAIPGRVQFLRATRHPADFEELVVVFDQPVAEAEALREQVIAQEEHPLQAPGQGDQ